MIDAHAVLLHPTSTRTGVGEQIVLPVGDDGQPAERIEHGGRTWRRVGFDAGANAHTYEPERWAPDELLAVAVDPRSTAQLAAMLTDDERERLAAWERGAIDAGLDADQQPAFRSGLYAATYLLRSE